MAALESSGNETETDNESEFQTPSKEPDIEFVPDEKPLQISRRSARLSKSSFSIKFFIITSSNPAHQSKTNLLTF